MSGFSATFSEFVYHFHLQSSSTATIFEVTGTHTGDSSNTVLIDSNATFITDGVMVGDTVTVGLDTAAVVTVDSETQITTDGLAGAGDTSFDSADTYTIDNGDVLRICVYVGENKKHFLRDITGVTDHAGGHFYVYQGNNNSTPILQLPFPQSAIYSFMPALPISGPGIPYIIEMEIATEAGSSLNLAWECR